MALVRERRQVRRPDNYDERMQETLRALRYIRIDERTGALTLLRTESAEVPVGSLPIYPSFAVLQLHLLNDQTFKAHYVETPLVFERPGVVDYAASINKVKRLLKSLVDASRLVGDLTQSDTAAVLTREPRLFRDYPRIYALLRDQVLQRLDALRGTVMTKELIDYIYDQRWRVNADVLRTLNRIENDIRAWYSALSRGGQLSDRTSNQTALRLAGEVNSQLLPLLIAEAQAAGGAATAPPRVTTPQRPPRAPITVKPEPVEEEREPVEEESEEEEEVVPVRRQRRRIIEEEEGEEETPPPVTEEGEQIRLPETYGEF